MTEQTLITAIVTFLGIVVTAFLSGKMVGSAVNNALKEVHNSPIIMEAIRALAASFPPEVAGDVHEAASIIEDATAPAGVQTVTTTTTTSQPEQTPVIVLPPDITHQS